MHSPEIRRVTLVPALAVLFACLLAGIVPGAAAAGKDLSYRVLKMRDGRLSVDGIYYAMHVTDNQPLYDGELTPGQRVGEYVKASGAGITGFKFQLRGFNEDGTAIDSAYLDKLFEIKDESDRYWMNAVCDVLGAYPDATPKFRKNAAKTAAQAFNGRGATLFWIDGEDSADLAALFHKVDPTLIVASRGSGNVDLVAAAAQAQADRPFLVVGALPEAYDVAYSTYVPFSDTVYARHEAAMLRPLEKAPVTLPDDALSAEEQAEGFHSLFDGKTLNGWSIIGPNKDGFIVEDGAIVWNGLGGFVMLSQKTYSDFVLRLEWRVYKEKGNAGVFLRCPRTNRMSRMGFEVQMMGDHGSEPTKESTGAIYDVLPATADASNPVGEWNAYEITVQGPHVRVVLNGQEVQNVNFDEHDALRLRKRSGFIGLQDHGNPAAYRNIRVKELAQ
ncbi:MAG: DUF1080 domain-containing protein [Candidatus Hydrogenedentes bacterium]|nr:DUF1080 domain-containing protein [Candidatus Hydrogenedentota bacterium]